MGVELERLGPAAQAQIRAELKRRELMQKAARRQELAQARPKGRQDGSRLEDEYYRLYIWPRELAGEIAKVERHKRFELLPKSEYCGLRLPAAHYTPDFVITYKSGTVEAVEVKHAVIRRLQGDYIYRRRLFIELVARPRGWIFTEYIKTE